MLSQIWPTYDLSIHTPRLVLRLPDEEERYLLADLAGRGVHAPHERPFLTPWTDGSALERSKFALREHWFQLYSWEVSNWRLGLGVFRDGSQPVGMVTLRTRDFPVVREVTTFSWLAREFQGDDLGTEARIGALSLAFDHLDATDAVTEVFQDNAASQGVSRKLGYEPDGISRDARGNEVLVSDRLRLTAQRWAGLDLPTVEVSGIDEARAMFLGQP